MLKNTSKDIYSELNLMPITLLSNKLKVLVIGGGQGALIKAKSFLNKGCYVEAIALEFIEDFNIINNIKLIKKAYTKEVILDKHIVIIAINNDETIKEIIDDCESLSKIYINSTNFREGLGIIPVSRQCENITIAVNTKLGNPKASVMVAEYIIEKVKPMDEFIGFTSIIRNSLNIDKKIKSELLTFINTMEFKGFYDKGKHYSVLRLFYDNEIINKLEMFK